jgi:predicted aldo/keto reductase-like oxidoreductase
LFLVVLISSFFVMCVLETKENSTMKNKPINRRQFVSTIATGAGFLALGTADWVLATNRPAEELNPFKLIKLGKSGIKTSLLGMGTGFSGGNRSSAITRAGRESAISLIRYAYDTGVRFFDCADSYGTHTHLAAALKGIPRTDYTIGTKIWVGGGGIPESERPDANIVVDRFRKELGTDYIDLVQIHCMTDKNWTLKYKRQLDILEELKVKGVIRAHGVSVHSLDAMEAAADSSWVDVIHVRINPYGESMDHPDPSRVLPVIQKLHEGGKGVIGMKLIGNGRFKNDNEKINASLNYVLGLGTVDMMIVGFEQSEQIVDYASRIKKALVENPLA